MAMNLLKIQDQLKGMADDYLMQHAQQPTGEIPQFMVAAEMQRRKDMREQTQQAPDTTVVDDLEQQGLAALQPPPAEEAGPEQMDAGLAALPTDMPEAPSMAGGGIVAFNGETGSDVAFNRAIQGSFLGRENLGNAMGLVDQYAPNIKNLVKQAGGILVDIITGLRWIRNPYTGELQAASEVVNNPNSGKLAELGPMGPQMSPSLLPPDPAAMTLPTDINTVRNLSNTGGAPVPEAPVVAPKAMGYNPSAPAEPPMRGYQPTNFSVPDVTYTDMPSADAAFSGLQRPELTAEEYMAQMKKLVGANTGLAGLKDKLAGMEAKAAGEEEQAPWMALMQAGLGMAAGTSPYALSNIAAGGIEGLKGYTAAKQRLDEKQEKRFALESQIAQAEHAEQVASAKYGAESAQADKARNDKIALEKAKTTIDIGVTNATNKLKVQETNARNKLTAKELGITEKHYNDMYNVQLRQVDKSLQGIEKQGIQQQTAILNNLLDQADANIKNLNGDLNATDTDKATARAQRDAIQSKLMSMTGVNYTPPVAAPAGKLTPLPKGSGANFRFGY
jgi:hypothetical protein